MKLDELVTNSKVLIIDNKFYGKISSRYKVLTIPESRAIKQYKEIVLLADNLANYIRIRFSEIEDYRKRAEIIRKFWK